MTRIYRKTKSSVNEVNTETIGRPQEIIELLKSAVSSKISRIQLSIDMTQQKLLAFEKKYNVSSEHFFKKMAAEDLDDGDMEYVEWAGEYQILQRLKKQLKQLQGIKFAHQ
ncbi:MAG: hypothetical protein ACE5PV_04635 [Candidatus Poribacteria bacterium]